MSHASAGALGGTAPTMEFGGACASCGAASVATPSSSAMGVHSLMPLSSSATTGGRNWCEAVGHGYKSAASGHDEMQSWITAADTVNAVLSSARQQYSLAVGRPLGPSPQGRAYQHVPNPLVSHGCSLPSTGTAAPTLATRMEATANANGVVPGRTSNPSPSVTSTPNPVAAHCVTAGTADPTSVGAAGSLNVEMGGIPSASTKV